MPRQGQKFRAEIDTTRPKLSPKMISQRPSSLLRFVRRLTEMGEGLAPGELDLIRSYRTVSFDPATEELKWEFSNILLSPAVLDILELLVDLGLLGVLIPELLRGKGMKQSFIHPDDVLTHNLLTCSLVKPLLHLRLAGLLHDVGKPDYYVDDPLVGRRFPNHSSHSAALVPIILGRFSYSAELIQRVRLLVENHMFIWIPRHGPEPVRELMERVGKENIGDLIELITSDREAIWGDEIRECNKALWHALAIVITDTGG